MLTAAAMESTRLRVQTAVLGNDYRHPVVTHRMAATLDVMSEGRLELGIGAGWMLSDYLAAGLAYDRPGVRIERLAESIAVLKGLFAGEPFTFTGVHFTVRQLVGVPAAVQRSHPPLLIGGGGPRLGPGRRGHRRARRRGHRAVDGSMAAARYGRPQRGERPHRQDGQAVERRVNVARRCARCARRLTRPVCGEAARLPRPSRHQLRAGARRSTRGRSHGSRPGGRQARRNLNLRPALTLRCAAPTADAAAGTARRSARRGRRRPGRWARRSPGRARPSSSCRRARPLLCWA